MAKKSRASVTPLTSRTADGIRQSAFLSSVIRVGAARSMASMSSNKPWISYDMLSVMAKIKMLKPGESSAWDTNVGVCLINDLLRAPVPDDGGACHERNG